MTYTQIKKEIQDYKQLPNGSEKNALKAKLRAEIDKLFRKTMQPANSLIQQLAKAEQTQNANQLGQNLGKKIDDIHKEGQIVLRLYQEL